MKNKIYTTFSEGFHPGQFIRLNDNDSLNLYIGKDDNGCFSFEFLGHFTPTRLVGSEVISVSQTKHKQLISIRFSLENQDLLEYFCTFCEDLVNSTLDITDDNIAYKLLSQRYLSWKRLFRPNQGRLNENEVMGLIGELLYLKDNMFVQHGPDSAIEAWTGPEYTHKDFSLDNEWHEVKTISTGKGAIKIASLEQLDSDIDGTLAVYELEKMSSSFNGIKLNEIVNSILQRLNIHQREIFLNKLSGFGYDFSPEYNNYVFSLSSFEEYVVNDSFPRLKREFIPISISCVRYDLNKAELEPFKMSTE